jgi:hypothetical protein
MRLNLTESEATVLWAILRNVGGAGANRDAADRVLEQLTEKLRVEPESAYAECGRLNVPIAATWMQVQERIVPRKNHRELPNAIYLG